MFSSCLVIATVAALPLFASALPDNCARTYTIVEGDTCDAISAAHNTSTYQLATVNSNTINEGCTNLAIGQQICLGTTGEDCDATYVVVPNDTCDIVTAKLGVNATILYANNPQIDSNCDNLYVNEVLCAANVVRVPPASPGSPVTSVAIGAGTATAASQPLQTPAQHSSTDSGDDEDIPECEDPNDNGEW